MLPGDIYVHNNVVRYHYSRCDSESVLQSLEKEKKVRRRFRFVTQNVVNKETSFRKTTASSPLSALSTSARIWRKGEKSLSKTLKRLLPV